MFSEVKKLIFLLLLVIGLVSCYSKQKKTENQSADKSESINEKILPNESNGNNYILGVWWDANDKEAPYATFMITDSAIIYPDQVEKSDFKYQIINDSLKIFFDGFISTSKIERLTNDTLVLITFADTITLFKTKE